MVSTRLIDVVEHDLAQIIVLYYSNR